MNGHEVLRRHGFINRSTETIGVISAKPLKCPSKDSDKPVEEFEV